MHIETTRPQQYESCFWLFAVSGYWSLANLVSLSDFHLHSCWVAYNLIIYRIGLNPTHNAELLLSQTAWDRMLSASARLSWKTSSWWENWLHNRDDSFGIRLLPSGTLGCDKLNLLGPLILSKIGRQLRLLAKNKTKPWIGTYWQKYTDVYASIICHWAIGQHGIYKMPPNKAGEDSHKKEST